MLFQFCCEPQEQPKRSLDLLESVATTTTAETTTATAAEDTTTNKETTMDTPDSCTTLSSSTSTNRSSPLLVLEEDEIATGALTPAISNVSAADGIGWNQRGSTPPVCDATTVTVEEEEEQNRKEEEESLGGDSWEPIPPVEEEEGELAEEEFEMKKKQQAVEEEESKPWVALSQVTSTSYMERSLSVDASVVKKKKDTEHKAPSYLVLAFLAALLLAIMAATGKLDSLLEEAVEARVRTKSAFVVVTEAPTVAPAPATTIVEEKKIPKTESSESVTPKKDHPKDASNYVWLSLDDDVIAGPVFWENDTQEPATVSSSSTSKNASTPKEVRSNDQDVSRVCEETFDLTSLAYQPAALLLDPIILHDQNDTAPILPSNETTLTQPTKKKRSMKKGPFRWIARHYQRLNVWVLGQSQLAQIKRKTSMMQWGPQ